MIIKSIDLWTEQKVNHYECFNGAFIDGFQKNINPFNKYKVVKNCNCIITTDKEKFIIEHKCAFINQTKTRIIPMQENSKLTNN